MVTLSLRFAYLRIHSVCFEAASLEALAVARALEGFFTQGSSDNIGNVRENASLTGAYAAPMETDPPHYGVVDVTLYYLYPQCLDSEFLKLFFLSPQLLFSRWFSVPDFKGHSTLSHDAGDVNAVPRLADGAAHMHLRSF